MDSASTRNNANNGMAFIRPLHAIIIFFVLLCLAGSLKAQENSTPELYETYRSLVYQIQVIDKASGDKSSIGSGFQIDQNGLLATNYHVVSQYVQKPGRYRLQSINLDKQVQVLELLAIDVIHDLALVHITENTNKNSAYFSMAEKPLNQGDKIFSMGNPHDLGMTIIEGTYNGFLQASRFDRILFSGSLNAGMSGGPAFNQKGEIIGINVAKGGEQLSFLVPVKHLQSLVDKQNKKPEKLSHFDEIIHQDVMADQQEFFSGLLGKDWAAEPMAELVVPGEISRNIRCWGGSNKKTKRRFERAFQECRSQDNIYISANLIVSKLAISYIFLENIDLNPISFARAVELNSYHDQLNNAYDEEDISNFHCQESFIEHLDRQWKARSCMRGYKKMAGLYDFSFVATSIDDYNKAAILNLDVAGISQQNIDLLLARFLEEVKWPAR